MLNSRVKDFFDLWVLASHSDFNVAVLARAVTATFEHRSTPFPQSIQIGLRDEFISDAHKTKQWQAFLRKNPLSPMSLSAIIKELREFLLPVLLSDAALNINS